MRSAGMPSRTRSHVARSAAAGVALLLALRIVFLIAALDPEEERVMTYLDPGGLRWSDGPERPLYDREELYAGTAAEAILHGLPLPLGAYRFMPYGSGSLLISMAAVPFYALFGPRYLVFKILPLLVTLAGGICWTLVVRAWLGPRAARLFALLYLLAPPVLVRTALIAKGDHAEAMALIGAILCLASAAVLARSEPSRERWAAASGLLAGFGVFVTYSTIPVVVAAAVTGFILSRGRPRRVWAVALGALLAGLLPWLILAVSSHGAALRVYGHPLGAMVSPRVALARLELLGNSGLLAGYDLQALGAGPGLRQLAGILWLLAVAAGWFALLRRIRTRIALLVLAPTATLIAAFCLSAPDASSRYLVPGYPLFLMAAVCPGVVARGPSGQETESVTDADAGRARRFRWGLTGAVLACVLGLVSQASVILGSSYPALHGSLRGTDWPLLGEIVGTKLDAEQIRLLPADVRPFFWVGYGRRAFWATDPSGWPGTAAQAGTDAGQVWKGVGIAWMEIGRVEAAGAYLRELPDSARAALDRGLAFYGEVVFSQLIARGGEYGVHYLFSTLDPADQPLLRRSLAQTVSVMATQGAGDQRALTRVADHELPPELAAWGAGWSLPRGLKTARIWHPPAGAWTARFAGITGAGLRPGGADERACLEGMAAARLWHVKRLYGGGVPTTLSGDPSPGGTKGEP